MLEHIHDRISSAAELIRVLRPQGYLILTFDVCFQGDEDILPGPFAEVTNYLRQNLELVWPEVSIHPSRVLSCYNGPYPYGKRCTMPHRIWRKSKGLARRMIGQECVPLDCVFMGMVLRKT